MHLDGILAARSPVKSVYVLCYKREVFNPFSQLGQRIMPNAYNFNSDPLRMLENFKGVYLDLFEF